MRGGGQLVHDLVHDVSAAPEQPLHPIVNLVSHPQVTVGDSVVVDRAAEGGGRGLVMRGTRLLSTSLRRGVRGI